MDYRLLGHKLKDARIQVGMTQQDIANILHVRKSTISNYENGKSQPDLESLSVLCAQYNLDYRDLLSEFFGEATAAPKLYQILKNLLKYKHISALEASRMCGLPDTEINMLISTKREKISLSEAVQISEGLGITERQLAGIDPINYDALYSNKQYHSRDCSNQKWSAGHKDILQSALLGMGLLHSENSLTEKEISTCIQVLKALIESWEKE